MNPRLARTLRKSDWYVLIRYCAGLLRGAVRRGGGAGVTGPARDSTAERAVSAGVLAKPHQRRRCTLARPKTGALPFWRRCELGESRAIVAALDRGEGSHAVPEICNRGGGGRRRLSLVAARRRGTKQHPALCLTKFAAGQRFERC